LSRRAASLFCLQIPNQLQACLSAVLFQFQPVCHPYAAKFRQMAEMPFPIGFPIVIEKYHLNLFVD